VRTPELVTSANGHPFARFRIACNRRPSKNNGETLVDFFDVEVWGRQAENLCSSCSQGERLMVAGKMRFQEWTDKEGERHTRYVVAAELVGLSLEYHSFNLRSGNRDDLEPEEEPA
jgi:single-strand DNA-binding protein